MPPLSVCGHAAAARNGTPAGMAGKFGHSEGNCATPKSLYESALDFMHAQAPDADRIVFTGDFGPAGLCEARPALLVPEDGGGSVSSDRKAIKNVLPVSQASGLRQP